MPVVGDGDDEQQVESYSEHRDAEQQHVQKHGLSLRRRRPPAGAVEELWKAELGFLHYQRQEEMLRAALYLLSAVSGHERHDYSHPTITHWVLKND